MLVYSRMCVAAWQDEEKRANVETVVTCLGPVVFTLVKGCPQLRQIRSWYTVYYRMNVDGEHEQFD